MKKEGFIIMQIWLGTINTIDVNLFCQDKASGNYFYPGECSSYIACNSGTGYKMPCAAATLVYDQSQDRCDNPSQTFVCTALEVASQYSSSTPQTKQHTLTSPHDERTSSQNPTFQIRTSSPPDYSTDSSFSGGQSSNLVTKTSTTTGATSTSQYDFPTTAGTEIPSVSTDEPTCENCCSRFLLERTEFWNNETNQRIYKENLPNRLKVLVQILKVNVSELTSRRTKLISAPDSRLSSRGIGYVGAVVIGCACLLVCLLDALGVFQRTRNPNNIAILK